MYANLSWVNRIRFAPNQAVRGNQVMLSARYETRNFEANINSNLYEYERIHLGLGLRYRFLVIGPIAYRNSWASTIPEVSICISA